jgi:hypothetical protein
VSKSVEKQRVPIRAIIMILVALTIAFAALGFHGFLNRNQTENAALLAQAAKLSAQPAASSATTAAASASQAEAKPVCLLVVGDPARRTNQAAVSETRTKLTGADVQIEAKVAAWPAGRNAPIAPKVTTVYSVDGQDDLAAKAADAVDAKVVDRPAALMACAQSVTIVVR